MDHTDYAPFLPREFRQPTAEPEHTWWDWAGCRVHVARARRPDAPARVVLLHGSGGHAGALWPIASLIAAETFDLAAPDMPLYGRTVVPDPAGIRYTDWIELLCDFVESEDDGRPLVLVGASMGGMLAYEVAARTGRVTHVLATCLLDPSGREARRAASRFPVLGGPAPRLLGELDRVAGRLRIPIALAVDMQAMSADRALARQCAADPRGGGVRMPVGFLASYFTFAHTRPERFTQAPVTLVHPAEDTWTPPRLSAEFLGRIAAETRLVLLENCGHFPIEQPGFGELISVAREVCLAVGKSA
ncbi:alpha/beta hydrolase [Saccharomonospora sp. NPDC046836]|uniref:alpha/beta fold hydrolase n=1 Tax=Saccharomonospora sp. NPDC046836 TaxID=3156921 RepID=UPI003406BE2F